ncbi:agmatine deiminase family protein [Kitasatospora sp. CM 4170]|uniref:Agmatine/peptidylarginine deiminase n=1 Tax=Kitasatospora aburaviensis TaxID=67265 RepID=A0ABW1F7N0_9ACTN|nr:agmatine deiminase family protein [Kitasatospora sp. CM 4170]WNM49159.1 agmatine deiminase family protein [Kitasatospora sp. CM 4170]
MSDTHGGSRSLFGRLFGAPPPRAAERGQWRDPEHGLPQWWVDRDDVPHARTWMSWPSRKSVWGRQLAGVQQDIALIARTVARFEPVVMCAPDDYSVREARSLCGPGVTVTDDVPTDDLWMRDTAPVFRRDGGGRLDAVGLNFNGWGGKQTHRDDAEAARGIAGVLGLPFSYADFVGEGGSVETDGDGTLMATESSLVNKNRNRGMSRDEIEEAVLDVYGADRMIWVPGIRGKDITDDHIDVTSRFVRPGVVMVQLPPADRRDVWARDAREQFDILSRATDARGRRLRVIRVDGPDTVRSRDPKFVDSYLNFHVVNGGVITAQFGDPAKDEAARRALAEAFPGREVVQLDVDRLMAGGGGIHCSTMQEPLP